VILQVYHPGLTHANGGTQLAQAKAKNITHSLDALNADVLIVLYDAYVAAAAALLGVANQPRAAGAARTSLRVKVLLQGGTSPPPVALKAIDNPDSDCSAICRLKVQCAIRAKQHRSRHLRAYFLGDDLNFALSVHWPPYRIENGNRSKFCSMLPGMLPKRDFWLGWRVAEA
jgi:hypothetical protein